LLLKARKQKVEERIFPGFEAFGEGDDGRFAGSGTAVVGIALLPLWLVSLERRSSIICATHSRTALPANFRRAA